MISVESLSLLIKFFVHVIKLILHGFEFLFVLEGYLDSLLINVCNLVLKVVMLDVGLHSIWQDPDLIVQDILH